MLKNATVKSGVSKKQEPVFLKDLPRKLNSLQWLRAIGALAVVYFHAAIQLNFLNPEINILVIGETGVDIFFVLSGFIMWATTKDSVIKPKTFILNRIKRIVPLYWVLTVVVSIVAFIFPYLLKSTHFDKQHLAASLFFAPWPNPAGQPGTAMYISPVIVPGWTLNMEMMFYLLFSICLSFEKVWRVSVLSILIIALYILGNVGERNGLYFAFYNQTIIFEFLMGVVLGACLMSHLKLSALGAWLLLTFSLVALVCIEAVSPDLPRAVQFGLPAFFAIAAAVNLERVSAIPNVPALVELGNASYSIYLSHIFVLAGLRMAWTFFAISTAFWGACLFIAIALVASAIFGYFIYIYIEKGILSAILEIRLFARGTADLASK